MSGAAGDVDMTPAGLVGKTMPVHEAGKQVGAAYKLGLADARRQVLDLHKPVQWTGWQLWLQRFGHNGLAFVDRWCVECRQPWPCRTAEITTPPAQPPTQPPAGDTP